MARLPIFDAGRAFDMTGLDGTWKDVGAVMGSAVIGFVIYNTSDVDCKISFDDGTTEGPTVPSGGVFDSSRFNMITRQENASYVIAEGAQIQTQQVTGAGASGDLYINIVRV